MPRPIENLRKTLPDYVEKWFLSRGWSPHRYQREMADAFVNRQSTLLIAPTGGGKTLSGFLPSLIDCHETRAHGIHTLYVSPLKALTNDIERNLMRPVAEMGLCVTVESRTGDTPQTKRARQRRSPPNIFLTTPESLMLMLSTPEAERMFSSLRAVIVDEVHSFAATKRGDFTALALSRLSALSGAHMRTGLSATVADSGSARGMARPRRRACASPPVGPAHEARYSHHRTRRHDALWRLHGALRRP